MRRRCDIKNRFARWHFPYSEAAGESGCWKQTAVLLQMIPPIRFFFSFHFFFLSKSSSRFGILLSPPTLKKEKDQPKKKYVVCNWRNMWEKWEELMTYIFLSVYQIVFGEKSYILLYSFCKIHKYVWTKTWLFKRESQATRF